MAPGKYTQVVLISTSEWSTHNGMPW
jgi:hypothetical protein